MRLWVLWDFTESIYLESRWSENIFTIGWQFWTETQGPLQFNELFHTENSMNAWPWYRLLFGIQFTHNHIKLIILIWHSDAQGGFPSYHIYRFSQSELWPIMLFKSFDRYTFHLYMNNSKMIISMNGDFEIYFISF